MVSDDIKHVELLSMFHYIVGGITALFACIPLVHIFLGLAMISGKLFENGKGGPPPFLGWIFVIMGSIFIVLGWCMAIMILIAGRQLKRRKHRVFCMAAAGIECIMMPFGTVLGVFTLIALNKDSIRALFDVQVPPLPPPGS